MNRIAIIGGGLAGSLLAIYLARRGLGVDVFEARSDLRKTGFAGGRSINLALSDRGIAALSRVGMDDYMLAEAVPMRGRMIHLTEGATTMLPYSGREGEFINSVSRGGLNSALITAAEQFADIKFHFNEKCIGADLETGTVRFESGREIVTGTIIAADGAGSAIRDAMNEFLPEMTVRQTFLEHGYKELHIPPANGSNRFAIEPNALHIWPRHQFMMIALPNLDGSFTCTLFLARSGNPSFETLSDENAVRVFFEREFPDAVPLMPTLIDDFFANPTGHLGTLRARPWHYRGRVLLIGDAAHAMVPFYGQGMNCAFEDVSVLDTLIDKHRFNWEAIFSEFEELRMPQAEAIQQMAEENFYEMRDATADPVFRRKRELETLLEQRYPDYFSKYSMVTFREDLPYTVARDLGNAQDRLLMEICRGIESISELDLEDVHRRLMSLASQQVENA